MRYSIAASAYISIVLIAACSKPPQSGGMHATVTTRDGKVLSGTVLSSSASEIQLSGEDHVTQTIPMSQVQSVDYGSNSAAPSSASLPQSSSAPSQVASTSPSPSQPAAPIASSPTYPAPQPVAPPPINQPAPPPSAEPMPPPPPERHENHYHPAAAAITSRTLELGSGTQVSVRTEETIDSRKAVANQTFAAEVTADVHDAEGNVVIPRGSNAQIVIKSASKGRKINGAADLVMDLASISVDGRLYDVSTADLSQRGRSGIGANKRTGEFAGGGAAFGAIIGAIAGGGKGAAIGAGSGLAAGAITQVVTKGTIKVPAETILTFRLDQPLQVKAAE